MSPEPVPATAPPQRAETVFGDACKLIGDHLSSACLTAEFLCHELQVSGKSLARLFADHGGVRAYVRRQRLERVRETLLNDGNRAGMFALARRWQFNDPAHLRLAFRQAYGTTPIAFIIAEAAKR